MNKYNNRQIADKFNIIRSVKSIELADIITELDHDIIDKIMEKLEHKGYIKVI